MYSQGKNRVPVALVEWDWKENPNWLEVMKGVNLIQSNGFRVKIHDVVTNSDQNAIIICADHWNKEAVQCMYNKSEDYFDLE